MKNNNGFTLIEILAVITVLGILMIIAIPSISRTVENARKDTFLENANVYINAVREAVIADELMCDGVTVSAIEFNRTYHFKLDTDKDSVYYGQTKDLLENPALSTWGNSDVKGSVLFYKLRRDDVTEVLYYILLVDNHQHGISPYVAENSLSRNSVSTSGALYYSPVGTECILK